MYFRAPIRKVRGFFVVFHNMKRTSKILGWVKT
nr:MAG TPA: hypothetical protein [Caudoviricetes sp.]